jgi:hypothetical protein
MMHAVDVKRGTARSWITTGTATIVAVTAIAAGSTSAQAVAPQDLGPVPVGGSFTAVPTTRITTFARGNHLRWTAFDLPPVVGANAGILDQTRTLQGVAGGAPGIIETGSVQTATSPTGTTTQAASWVSADGGRTWTEHVTPGTTWFGSVVGHGGVFVAVSPVGLWSSRHGATWTRATTGPRDLAGVATLAAGPQGFVVFRRSGTIGRTHVWVSRTGAPGSWVLAPTQAVVSGFCPSSLVVTTTRVLAVGHDCTRPSIPRVLVSRSGRTWARTTVPTGLRTTGTYVRGPSLSVVGGRFVLAGANARQSATWLWMSVDGRVWRHFASLPRKLSLSVDRLQTVVRLGAGYLAVGDRDQPADDAELAAWWSADLLRWARVTPATVAACHATVHSVNQAAVASGRLVMVGNPWSMGGSCAESWTATPIR